MCFVRQRVGDAMVLTTYGRSSGFCIDPIEKKPLNHFYPGSRACCRFGTAGCNLACKFCQNWDISKSREMDRLMDAASPERIAEAARASGAASVAFTYNDPVIFAEYAMDTADACHALGLHSVAVTAGYMHAAPRREFYAKMDAANVDLKGFTEEFYFQQTGAHLAPVLDTLAVPAARDRLLVRDHDAADPGAQRQQRRDRRDDALDRRPARARRAAALHGVPSRLQDAGRAADAAGDVDARPRDRARQRPAPRLHRQRARRRRRHDLLSGLPRGAGAARLVRGAVAASLDDAAAPARIAARRSRAASASSGAASAGGGFRCAWQ